MADKVRSPYVGLVPYSEADARFFFGRERDVRRVVAQLYAARLTLLYGASGVGKSSLLGAGVVTELRRRARAAAADGEQPDVHVVYFNAWQGDPVAAFRAAVESGLSGFVPERILMRALVEPTLTGLVTSLIEALETDLFIIFDQFEEFFLYHARGGAPQLFERDFADLATRPGLPASMLIALRDDSLSQLDHFKALIPNLFANYIRITHLTPDDARQAIVEPVRAYNALPEPERDWQATMAVEAALVEDVIDGVLTGRVAVGDLGRGQVASAASGVETPYLQLVMSELWRHEHSLGSTTLRASTLQELGGAEAIVQNHLDSTVGALGDADRETCARMFQYLVTPSGTKIAYSALDLAGLVERPANDIELVLARLSGSSMRILSPVAPTTDRPGPVLYEIYHDSLAHAILDWRRRYVTDREKAEIERARVEQERELQEELGRQTAQREQAERVAAAERARAETEVERAAEQRASARRFKLVAAFALVLAAAALAAGAIAWRARAQARLAENRANQIQEEARRVASGQEDLIKQYQNQLATLGRPSSATPDADATNKRLLEQAEAYRKQLARLNADVRAGGSSPPDGATSALRGELELANTTIGTLEKQLASLPQIRDELSSAQTELGVLRATARDQKALIGKMDTELTELRKRPEFPGSVPEPGSTTARAHTQIREVLQAYATAYPAGNLTEIRTYYPSFGTALADAIRQSRGDFPGYALTIAVNTILVMPDFTRAVVQVRVEASYEQNRQRRPVPMKTRWYYLERRSEKWLIVNED